MTASPKPASSPSPSPSADWPRYMSSKGYGFVWNSPSLGSVTIDSDKIQWASIATLGVDFWITTTASPSQLTGEGVAVAVRASPSHVRVPGCWPLPLAYPGAI